MKLGQLIIKGWNYFANLTDCTELIPKQTAGLCILMILGFILCFFGILTYHVFFSGLLYIGTVTLFCILWKDNTDWGYLAAGFTVVGCGLAFLGFRFKSLAAEVIPGTLLGALFYTFFPIWYLALLFGIAVMIAAHWFHELAVNYATAVVGGILLTENTWRLCTLYHVGFVNFQIIAVTMAGVCLAGFLTQWLIRKKRGIQI